MEYDNLFTPMKIGSCEIKNRFVMCPMEGTAMIPWLTKHGYNGEVHDLLVERAKDGVGLIIPGAIPLYSLIGYKALWKHPKAFNGVKETIDEVHRYGTKVFFQISAGLGRNLVLPEPIGTHYKLMNFLFKVDKFNTSADADLPNVWNPDLKTKRLSEKEIQNYIKAMAETAYLCKLNGVDGIDIHALHEGYLLDQFAMPYTNHRTDKYGGSLENRLRFACEIVKAIKEKCGQDYPVILRYSVESKVKDFNHGIIPQDKESKEIGRDFPETAKALRILEEAGYDGFNADNGTYDSWYWAHPPVYMPLNCNLESVSEIKQYTSKPVICAGRMQLDAASRAIDEGKIDGVGIARQFLTDEHFLEKVRESRLEDIRPCISCHVGCMPIGKFKGVYTEFDTNNPTGICALNPYTRNEKKYAVIQTNDPKRFAVIGAGIAGMEFALQAKKRGHQVVVYERSDRLGGVFNEAASFSFKEKDRDLLNYYKRQVEKEGINIRFNTEVKDLSSLDCDEVIVATGSSAARQLKVKGSENSVSAIQFLKDGMQCKDRVVIIGGGLTGCEIAYELCLQGKHPVIIEALDDILKIKGSCMANTSFLRDAFKYYNVPVYVSAKVGEIFPDHVSFEDENGKPVVEECDTVVTSIGYISSTDIEENEHIHKIGDAARIANLMNAIWGANDLIIQYK